MKKLRLIYFNLILVFYLFCWFSPCFAWTLNANGGYVQLPFSPAITPDSGLVAYIMYFLAAGAYIAGTLAVVSLAIAGIQLIMSAENPSRASSAKEGIKASLLGLVIALSAVFLGGTIHPQFTNLGVTVSIPPTGGLHLLKNGGGADTGAPSQVAKMTNYGGKYDTLYWPETIKDPDGTAHSNCDPGIYAYMVYVYKNENFSGKINSGEIKCGGGGGITLAGAGSYYAVPERPGIYFYSGSNCNDGMNPNDSRDLFNYSIPQSAVTQSISSLPTTWTNANVRSIRIINGPDEASGPFFGVILFRNSNFSSDTAGVVHFDMERKAGSHCSNEIKSWLGEHTGTSLSGVNFGSALVYQRIGVEPGTNAQLCAGDGVTLFSQRENANGNKGLYCPTGHPNDCKIECNDVGIYYEAKLSDLVVTPQSNLIQPEESKLCPKFDSSGEKSGKTDCFQSMTISGNYVVVLSDFYDDALEGGGFTQRAGHAQAFPEKIFPSGPPDLNQTHIKPAGSKYIEVIPLAQPLWPSSQ